ncbi:hypothetical protein FIU87_02465 [Bacillus sp. THAF10]|uniref:hypothetical protein n=1 Tax=Bacillus sp. THAF10 TaxID=2587848 RepID=UPI00126838D3|nr:hypothetical protein [Bacillus sp. THAF10]QFT87503.1 hypothetical protein FIU87_02465 [Bacillus sp. THAF10]
MIYFALILLGIVIAIPILLVNKFESSMRSFFRGGFGGLGQGENSNYITCTKCQTKIKRVHTAPYCEKCRQFF